MRTHLLPWLLVAAATVSAEEKGHPATLWVGEAQFQVKVGGVVEESARAVVETALEISRNGEVRGQSGNGCRFSGIVLPGKTPTALKLRGQLTHCQFRPLNRRYEGSLVFDHKQGSATLQLAAQQERAGKSLAAEVSGVFARMK